MTLLTSIGYASASLLPGGLIIAAALLGGGWALAALAAMTLGVWIMDRSGAASEAPSGLTGLPIAVGALHFAVLAAVLWAMRAGWQGVETVALMLATGLYLGQISNACAHELIHRTSRAARRLGMAIYCSLLNGQHVSAHLLVHHVHAGTENDPNSAPKGQGFYRFFARACWAEVSDGLMAENRRRKGQRLGLHPFAIYFGGAALSLALATAIAGTAGLAALLVLSLHAQAQLLLSDYVQHYGLRRRRADGKLEPMGPRHCWNAPHPFSAAMLLAAPRHSDHHARPARSFNRLRLEPEIMPMLPRSMPVMCTLALVPPVWRHLMDPLVDAATAASPPFPAAHAA